MIESQLQKHLTEHLNAEIVLNSITNADSLKKWIRSTFLYVRAINSPLKYGFGGLSIAEIETELEGNV